MYCRVCEFKLKFVKDIKGEKTGELIQLQKCSNCGSYFSRIDSMDQNIDELPENQIDGYLNSERDVKKRINTLFAMLDGELSSRKCKKYLDIGCGVGWSLTVATEHGYESHGVEPEIMATKFASSKLEINVVNSYFSSDLFEREYFDLIVMDQVLEHLPNPQHVLTDAFKLLKPDGVFFLGVPPVDWSRKATSMSLNLSTDTVNKIRKNTHLKRLVSLIDKYDIFISPEGHINYFTVKGIKELAKECDAIIVRELHNNIYRAIYFPYINITTGSFILKKKLSNLS